MDPFINSEQQAIRELAHTFAREEMAPYAAEWDKSETFPVETLKKAAELGFASIYIDEALGGSGLDRVSAALIFEALATACPSTSAYLSIHNMVAWLIDRYANEALRKAWLPSICKMDCLTSYCLTEPDAGSDAASIKTQAKKKGGDYILNGTKAFISGGSASDIYAVMARTGDDGPYGISCFLVEKSTPGLSFGKKEHKLGWHSQPTSMVFFENCRIPKTHLIGEEGFGFNIALSALNGGRVNIAACSLGGAKQSLQLAKRYASERKQFARTLSTFQSIQFKLADMLTNLESSRLLVYRAAKSLDVDDPEKNIYCAMAKKMATDVGFQIVNDALQIFGGYGYLQDYPIERFFRDLRVHQILEGTNEIMRVIIAKRLLQENFVII